MAEGGCRCGKIRYKAQGDPVYAAMCHCEDCRASSGAPAITWSAFRQGDFTLISGEPQRFEGSPGAVREFCGSCGTGLFYRNDQVLPGLVDIQAVTFDDSGRFVPQIHVQVADRLDYMSRLDALPEFARYPSPE